MRGFRVRDLLARRLFVCHSARLEPPAWTVRSVNSALCRTPGGVHTQI
jgi:hypothetical protein